MKPILRTSNRYENDIANVGEDWSNGVDFYSGHTQTHTHRFNFIYKIKNVKSVWNRYYERQIGMKPILRMLNLFQPPSSEILKMLNRYETDITNVKSVWNWYYECQIGMKPILRTLNLLQAPSSEILKMLNQFETDITNIKLVRKRYCEHCEIDLPYNFCFIKFLPSLTVEAVDSLQTLFRVPRPLV